MNGFTKTLLILFVVVLAGASCAGLYAIRFLSHPMSDSTDEVTFEVRPGESFKTVSHHLEEQGLVSSGWKLRLLGRLSGLGGKVRVGEYAIRKNMKPKEILGVLASGRSIEYSITVVEGSNRYEIAEEVEKQKIGKRAEFLELTSNKTFIHELLGRDQETLEGYLFPETYYVTKYTGAKGLVKMMVERFKENYAKLASTPGWTKGDLDDHQIVTLASIIEKETGAPEERPVISSVFHNRLIKKMPLQTDPTIIYGIWSTKGAWSGNLSKADLTTPNRYNTYLNMGLPPGPISNPGFEALKAAGAPATTEFLFFVSRNNGTHVFSKDYAQHQKAVTEFQLDRRAREGHSWRELKSRDKIPDHVVSAAAGTTASTVKAGKTPSHAKQP